MTTQREALEQGLKFYKTGKPCAQGHDAPRYASTGACTACNAQGVKQHRATLARLKNNHAAGAFVYKLHPDDRAAALAYCQALDLQRGRTPWSPPVAVPEGLVLPSDIQRRRDQLVQHAASLQPTDDPLKRASSDMLLPVGDAFINMTAQTNPQSDASRSLRGAEQRAEANHLPGH